ncbi:hypothetical protein [Chloracidobacterium thermophilum]|uniref:hypothetical protein n=1 Tax=Chloracidobacterium thermophilum TaxID=458033 RepID=UPI0012FED2A8|nr:hypothetical protein [Chloracidobacterium thermophilum]
MPALFFPKFSKAFGVDFSRPGWAAIRVVCWTGLWCGLVVGQVTDQAPGETNQAPNGNVRKEAEEIMEKVFENCKRLSSYRATVRRTSSDFTDSDSEVTVCVKDQNRIEVRMRTNDGEWYGCSTPEVISATQPKTPAITSHTPSRMEYHKVMSPLRALLTRVGYMVGILFWTPGLDITRSRVWPKTAKI